jgi:hypothetical protein
MRRVESRTDVGGDEERTADRPGIPTKRDIAESVKAVMNATRRTGLVGVVFATTNFSATGELV